MAFVVGAVGTIAGTVLSYAVLRPWLGVEGYKARHWWLHEEPTYLRQRIQRSPIQILVQRRSLLHFAPRMWAAA